MPVNTCKLTSGRRALAVSIRFLVTASDLALLLISEAELNPEELSKPITKKSVLALARQEMQSGGYDNIERASYSVGDSSDMSKLYDEHFTRLVAEIEALLA